MSSASRVAAFVVALSLSVAAHANDYFVLNTFPDGPSSFAAAVYSANQNPGPDTIKFNIAGLGPHVIAPTLSLVSEGPLAIDGYSQPGSRANTRAVGSDADIRIVISGAQLSFSELQKSLLTLRGVGSTVRGIAFVRAPYEAALRLDGGEHVVVGNFFGLYGDGRTVGSNSVSLYVAGEQNLIGSGAPDSRNVFANSTLGILITGRTAYRNIVRGNVFGATADMSTRLPFGNAAIAISNEAYANRIGDGVPGDENMILGNGRAPVGVLVGGPRVQAGQGETIDNAIYANTIVGFPERAIKLAKDPGVCAFDDALDADTGPNRCMNLPLIDSAAVVNGRLVVSGRVQSEPRSTPASEVRYQVLLYGNGSTCNTSAGGEAEFYIAGQFEIAPDAGGQATFSFDVPLVGRTPRYVTAQLGIRGDAFIASSSELSPCRRVATTASAPTITSVVADDGRATLTYTPSTSEADNPDVRYFATCSPNPVAVLLGASPVLLQSLTNGVEHTCRAYARNDAGNGALSNAVTFTPAPKSAPVITSTANATSRVLENFRFEISATGNPRPTVTLVGALPQGLAWDASTQLVTGTPARGTIGNYALRITAENSQGSTQQTLALVVGRGAPQLSIDAILDQPFGTEAIAAVVRTASTGRVTLRSATPTVCTVGPLVEPNTPDSAKGRSQRAFFAAVTLLREGRCALTAEQPADADFDAGTAAREFRVTSGALFRDGFELRPIE